MPNLNPIAAHHAEPAMVNHPASGSAVIGQNATPTQPAPKLYGHPSDFDNLICPHDQYPHEWETTDEIPGTWAAYACRNCGQAGEWECA